MWVSRYVARQELVSEATDGEDGIDWAQVGEQTICGAGIGLAATGAGVASPVTGIVVGGIGVVGSGAIGNVGD